MKLIVCSVFDSAIQAYGRPFFVSARGAAIRSFIDECNRKSEDSAIAAHPDDYELFQLGLWDDANGLFENGGVECLMRGKDAIASSGDKFVS